jgi:hypothetical protein
MKGKVIFFGVFMLALSSPKCIAQTKPNMPQSIISTSAAIRTYNDDKSLKAMSKGELVELYVERMKVIVRVLPKIGMATKAGVTMSDLGIPDTSDNKKALELEKDATSTYLQITEDYLRKMLPFCDKSQLMNGILFYEQTLKALKELEVQ